MPPVVIIIGRLATGLRRKPSNGTGGQGQRKTQAADWRAEHVHGCAAGCAEAAMPFRREPINIPGLRPPTLGRSPLVIKYQSRWGRATTAHPAAQP